MAGPGTLPPNLHKGRPTMNRSRLALFLPAIALAAAALLISPWNPGSPATTAVAQSCDPAYPDFCIPPPPPDLDCGEIAYSDFTVLEPDPHGLDGNDQDGRGCENNGQPHYQPTATPTLTNTPTPTATATATATATNTPIATATSPATATSTSTSPATVAATAAATPNPPATGTGTSSGGGSHVALFALAGLAIIGAAGFLVARRR